MAQKWVGERKGHEGETTRRKVRDRQLIVDAFCIFVIALFKWCGRKAAEGGGKRRKAARKEGR